MLKYRVFKQLSDHSFQLIAEAMFLEDAEAVYERFTSGMITEVGGEIIQTKNLTHDSDLALFGKGAHA